jgi:hypothetical protein
VAGLIRYDHAILVAKMGASRGKDLRVCTSHASIDRAVRHLYPNASHLVTATDRQTLRRVLDSDQCDIGFTWQSVAAVFYLHPCPQEIDDSSEMPMQCVDHKDHMHHGKWGRRLLHNPARQLIHLAPPDPLHREEVREAHAMATQLHCDHMQRRSRVGHKPGQASAYLQRTCAV